MSGTKAGGLKAAATNKAKHGEDFYSRLGRLGGRNGHTGGFASNPTLAKLAGAKGGRISKRGKAGVRKSDEERARKAHAYYIARKNRLAAEAIEKQQKRRRRFAWLFGGK